MKRLILVAMLVAGCGGSEPIVSAAGTWDTSFQMPNGANTLTMSIAQDDTGHLTGTATLNAEPGVLTGEINGRENAYLVLRSPSSNVVMQLAGLPDRMFGSVYVDGSAAVVEFARH